MLCCAGETLHVGLQQGLMVLLASGQEGVDPVGVGPAEEVPCLRQSV